MLILYLLIWQSSVIRHDIYNGIINRIDYDFTFWTTTGFISNCHCQGVTIMNVAFGIINITGTHIHGFPEMFISGSGMVYLYIFIMF